MIRTVCSYLASRFTLPEQSEHVVEQLRKRAARRHIIFVLRRPSYVKTAILRYICKRHGLPDPAFTLEEELPGKRGKQAASRMYLRARRGQEITLHQTRVQRKKLKVIYATAKRTGVLDNSVFVPVSLFAGRGSRPVPAPSTLNIDFPFAPLGDAWLLFVYAVHRQALEINIGPILEFPRSQSAHRTFSILSHELYWKEKRSRGARPLPPETIESIVLSGREFEATLDRLAIAASSSPKVVYERARQILHEMAARMHPRVVAAWRVFLSFLFGRLFTGIEVHGIEQLRSHTLKHPVILLPSHKSHFDYLLMSWILYHKKIPLPHVAAGNNLNFFPAGSVMRRAGAFFIRRRIENDYLYKTVLERYLTYLIKHGHMVQFFIEGGRSRSGLILPPRLGLLKTLVRSFNRGDRRDIMLVPISIAYEHVVEAKALSRERLGTKKRKESLKELLNARFIFKRRYGEVLVSIGEPISMREFADLPRTKSARTRDSLSLLTEDLGFEIVRGIADQTAITGSGAVAAGMMSTLQYRATEEVLVSGIIQTLQLIAANRDKTNVAPEALQQVLTQSNGGWQFCDIAVSTALATALQSEDLNAGLRELIAPLEAASLIRESTEANRSDVTEYEVDPDHRVQLSMYRNMLLHHVLPPILVLCAHRESNTQRDAALHSLHQLFKPVANLPHWSTWSSHAGVVRQRMQHLGWITEADGRLSDSGERVFRHGAALVLHVFDAMHASVCIAEELQSSWAADVDFKKMIHDRVQQLTKEDRETDATLSSDIDLCVKYLLTQGVLQVESMDIGKKSQRCYRLGDNALWDEKAGIVRFTNDIANEMTFLKSCSPLARRALSTDA